MSIPFLNDIDLGSLRRILNLPVATANGHALTYEQRGGGAPFPGYRSAAWQTFLPFANNPSGAAQVAGVLRSYIIQILSPVTITQRQIRVNSAVASTQIRVGLYNVGAGLYPTSLIANSDIAAIDTSTTGQKAGTFSSAITLQPGFYAVAYATSGAPNTINNPANNTFAIPERDVTQPTNRPNLWTGSFTFAALPSTYPSGQTPVNGGALEVIFLTQ